MISFVFIKTKQGCDSYLRMIGNDTCKGDIIAAAETLPKADVTLSVDFRLFA